MHLVAAFSALILLHSLVDGSPTRYRGIEKISSGDGHGERYSSAKCATCMDGFQHWHRLNVEHWYRYRRNAIVQCTHLLPQLVLLVIQIIST